MRVKQAIKDNLHLFTQDDFPGWIDDNYHIWQEFERRALRFANNGYEHFSSKCLFEVIRYKTTIREKNKRFKLNNNYTADMSRLFMLIHPDFDGFFEIRNKKS